MNAVKVVGERVGGFVRSGSYSYSWVRPRYPVRRKFNKAGFVFRNHQEDYTSRVVSDTPRE